MKKDLYTRACLGHQHEAMVEVCTQCSPQVYYVSLLLTGQEQEAVNAARYAFCHLWELLPACEDDDLDTLEGIQHFALNLAVDYCKAVYGGFRPQDLEDPFLEVLPVPPFLDRPDLADLTLPEKWGAAQSPFSLVQDLPPVPRFFLVMHALGGYSTQQLAQSFHLTQEEAAAALDTLQRQLEQRLAPSQRSYTWLVEALEQDRAQTPFPPAVNQIIEDHTRSLTDPPKRYQRRQAIFAILVFILVVLACLWELGMLPL